MHRRVASFGFPLELLLNALFSDDIESNRVKISIVGA